MKKYYDKNRNELKAGDYCYYTELPFSNYADSLTKIIEVNGELASTTLVTNFQGRYEVIEGGHPVELKYSQHINSNDGILTDYSKLNNFTEDALIYMNLNFPLSGN